jgi:hypothetical protein
MSPLSAKRLVSGLRRPPQPLPIPSIAPPDTHRRFNFNLRCVSGGAMERLWRGDGGECAAGLPWRLEIAEMRRVKAAKGSRRPEAHEPGKGPNDQNSTFPLEGTNSTNQPAKARTVSTDSNGNAAHQIARHVTKKHGASFGPLMPALPRFTISPDRVTKVARSWPPNSKPTE